MDAALRRIDEFSAEIDPLRAQLVSFARRQAGCRALWPATTASGGGCAVIIWAEIGDARRFGSSDQPVRVGQDLGRRVDRNPTLPSRPRSNEADRERQRRAERLSGDDSRPCATGSVPG